MQSININTLNVNKKYYKNVIINMKNNKIISLGCIISSYENGNYKISIRFYKIYSYLNNISLDIVNKILKNKFSQDISNQILRYYLKNDVSFISIKEDKKNNKLNTLKFTADINYINDTYEIFLNKPTLDNILIKENYSIFYKISKNLEKLLNNKICFDIDDIFNISDNEIDECIVHTISNNTIAWSINILE